MPNLSMGASIISSLRRATHLLLEAHLMISNPYFFVDEFAQAGTAGMATMICRARRARQIIHRIKPECSLKVDGGVDATTAPLAVGAGADVLVAGSAVSMTAKGSPPS